MIEAKDEPSAADASATGNAVRPRATHEPAAQPTNRNRGVPAGRAKPAEPADDKPPSQPPHRRPPKIRPNGRRTGRAATPERNRAEPAPDESSRSPRRSTASGEPIQSAADVDQAIAVLLVAQDDAAQDKAAQDNSAPDTNTQDEPAAETAPDSDEKPAANERRPPTRADRGTEIRRDACRNDIARARCGRQACRGRGCRGRVDGDRAGVAGRRHASRSSRFPQAISHEPLREMIKKQLDGLELDRTCRSICRTRSIRPAATPAIKSGRWRSALDQDQTAALLDDHSSGPGRHAGVSRRRTRSAARWPATRK